MFNDGSATPYTKELVLTNKQKSAAIAIIFYKGTGLNSDIYKGDTEFSGTIWEPGDTTTSRTLGVGLKCGIVDSTSWGWDDIKSMDCYIDEYSSCGDRNGSDNFEQIFDYYEANPSIYWNITYFKKSAAFCFVNKYKDQKIGTERISRIKKGSDYENGWYVPSIAEMCVLYKCFDNTENDFSINAASNLCGGDQFSGLYWLQSTNMYVLVFTDGNVYTSTIYPVRIPVCAIREFN
ncbi:MAG: hypothetical protein J6X78_08140 [Treponema sp.]|nr:hypothetical protein [Treponema sp.]